MKALSIGNGQLHNIGMLEITNPLDCMHDQQAILTMAAERERERESMVVRRLTPTECERLQGFPDGWTSLGDWVDTKGKKHKNADSPRYKALGNSIALPFWQYLADKIANYDPECKTMGSLFSGIGGFELVFARAGIKPVWASEIEEFCIAVTKKHFPEENE